MKITVIGGGNHGAVHAVRFSQEHDVALYVKPPYSRADMYSPHMQMYNTDSGITTTGKIALITENLREAVIDAEYIFITYPASLLGALADEMLPLLSPGQHLVFVPGSGGAEIHFRPALEKNCTITGLQRVHAVARYIRKGSLVQESGVRGMLQIASIPRSFNETAGNVLRELYQMPVHCMGNYLNNTLVNSNPILHTARLYSIFHDYPQQAEYDSLPLFYQEWDLESSELLIKMDGELFQMIDVLRENGMSADEITTLLEHYESTDSAGMTRKLNSIQSLKGLETPHIVTGSGKKAPDLTSRYFTTDFPYGLDILIALSEAVGVDCPNMRRVSEWYHCIAGDETRFRLQDYDIHSIEDLKQLYQT